MLTDARADPNNASRGARAIEASGAVASPEEVAEAVARGIEDERFLILSHPEVADYVVRRATDHDRWIGGMRRLFSRS